MRDWNVIVTVEPDRFRSACEQLTPLGRFQRTAYYNVITGHVDDTKGFMETLRDWMITYPDTGEAVARVSPISQSFTFETTSEFEGNAQKCFAQFAQQLDGKSFHVRLHRRGPIVPLGRCTEERILGDLLLETVTRAGCSSQVQFEDPDYIVVVETLDDRAGVALWSREELRRYPFLKSG